MSRPRAPRPIAVRWVALACLAVLSLGCIAADAVSQTPPARADESGYRFLWVRTILGPCCTDVGTDLVVDADGGVLIAGRRGGLETNAHQLRAINPNRAQDLRSTGAPGAL